MGRRNKNRKSWGDEFFDAIFGPVKQPKDYNPDWTRKCRQARTRNQRSYDTAQRRARRNGWRHP